MDTEAARRARQAKIKADLAEAYSDEEACPPEWVDILVEVDGTVATIRTAVVAETARFAAEDDIRRALVRRERVAHELRERMAALNTKIRRLNLIAPLPRFHRVALDPDDALRPLFRMRRSPDAR
jgi:hypothetical protein